MRSFFVVVLIAFAATIADAKAQSYPSRPITMLVGYAVGGPSDTIASARRVATGGPTSRPDCVV